MQGEDRHARILIDIEDSYQGATRQLSLQIPELTPEGYVQSRERTLSVKIPKGIREGQQIRLAGQGGAVLGSGATGDLYLEVAFKPHPRYRASGKDIYVDVPVMPWQAALGDSVSVATPSGQVKLKIPAGSQSGKTLRLKGGGLPAKSPGDFYAVLKLVNPPVDSAKAQAQTALAPPQMAAYEQRYVAIVQAGLEEEHHDPSPPSGQRGRKKQHKSKNLLDRLAQYQTETLAFMKDFAVPFDNNLAERDSRMMKVKQKVSGCFRTTPGAQAFCRIRSYLSTMKKQGHNVITALHSVFLGTPLAPDIPG